MAVAQASRDLDLHENVACSGRQAKQHRILAANLSHLPLHITVSGSIFSWQLVLAVLAVSIGYEKRIKCGYHTKSR